MFADVLAEQPSIPIALARPRSTSSAGLGLGLAGCARAVQHLEWLLLAAAAPALLFPGQWTGLGVGLIATTWVVRRVGSGRWSVPTGVDRAVALLCAALLVSLLPSVRLEYSLPKFWGLVLGLATFYAVLNTCRTQRALRLAEVGLLTAGLGVTLVGLVATAAPPDKLIDDRGIYASLPRLVASVQSSTVVTQGINPNEVGGVLVLLIPLAFALACRAGGFRWLALGAGCLMSFGVVLTQSRAGLLGLLVSACVGTVVLAGRRGLAILGVALVLGTGALIQLDGLDHLRLRIVGDAPSAGVESLSGRFELWQRGVAMALDMPITGIGLNTFSVILQTYYPTILHTSSSQVPHVHNLYLQTLLDFGLPGLLAWLAIVAAAVVAGRAALRGPEHRPLAVGLLLGLLAHGTYSLVDAVTLGAKPGPLLWMVLGLLLVLMQRPSDAASSASTTSAQPSGLPSSARRAHRTLRRLTWLVPLVIVSPLLAAGVSLNAATLLLHRGDSNTPFLTADLEFAQAIAPGPLSARAAAAQALQALYQGNIPAELDALARAQSLGGWDRSLGLRLGDLRLTTGDRSGALDAWRSAGALPTLLERGSSTPLDEGLQWYNLAQSLEPTDWRPFAGAAGLLEIRDPNRAATFLSQALRLRGDHPVSAAIAHRLVERLAPLPDPVAIPASSIDADLLARASHLLLGRQDFSGALLAAQASTEANPRSRAAWLALADCLDRIGRSTAAFQARAIADALQ